MKYISLLVFVLFACLGFIVPLENFALIWRCHHYRWRAANFDLCSALMAIDQWGFFSVPHLLRHRVSVYNVISKDPWHSYLLLSVQQWSCHYLFLRLRFVAFYLRGQRFNPLRRRRCSCCKAYDVQEKFYSCSLSGSDFMRAAYELL